MFSRTSRLSDLACAFGRWGLSLRANRRAGIELTPRRELSHAQAVTLIAGMQSDDQICDADFRAAVGQVLRRARGAPVSVK